MKTIVSRGLKYSESRNQLFFWYTIKKFDDIQGRRKHLKLGGHDTSRARSSLRRRGHVLNMKRALICLLKNLGGGHVPPVPPGSYVSVF